MLYSLQVFKHIIQAHKKEEKGRGAWEDGNVAQCLSLNFMLFGGNNIVINLLTFYESLVILAHSFKDLVVVLVGLYWFLKEEDSAFLVKPHLVEQL